jgi:PadR family transcriptional regulator AphA
MAARSLTTTHLSLLSLLALRPWSAYELVAHMRRSLDLIWPRAQSNLYADLKRLAEQGLASRQTARVGRRSRTIYAITAPGWAAVQRWLAEPGSAPLFECEALVKLAYVPAHSKAAALTQVAVLARHADDRLALGRRVADEYLKDDESLPARLHVNAVMWRFLWEQHQAIARWAAWADAEIRQWPDTEDTPELRRRGKQGLRQSVVELDK